MRKIITDNNTDLHFLLSPSQIATCYYLEVKLYIKQVSKVKKLSDLGRDDAGTIDSVAV